MRCPQFQHVLRRPIGAFPACKQSLHFRWQLKVRTKSTRRRSKTSHAKTRQYNTRSRTRARTTLGNRCVLLLDSIMGVKERVVSSSSFRGALEILRKSRSPNLYVGTVLCMYFIRACDMCKFFYSNLLYAYAFIEMLSIACGMLFYAKML